MNLGAGQVVKVGEGEDPSSRGNNAKAWRSDQLAEATMCQACVGCQGTEMKKAQLKPTP